MGFRKAEAGLIHLESEIFSITLLSMIKLGFKCIFNLVLQCLLCRRVNDVPSLEVPRPAGWGFDQQSSWVASCGMWRTSSWSRTANMGLGKAGPAWPAWSSIRRHSGWGKGCACYLPGTSVKLLLLSPKAFSWKSWQLMAWTCAPITR